MNAKLYHTVGDYPVSEVKPKAPLPYLPPMPAVSESCSRLPSRPSTADLVTLVYQNSAAVEWLFRNGPALKKRLHATRFVNPRQYP